MYIYSASRTKTRCLLIVAQVTKLVKKNDADNTGRIDARKKMVTSLLPLPPQKICQTQRRV